MAERLQYLRSYFLRKITLGGKDRPEKEQQRVKYDRLATGSDDGIENDEERALAADEKDLTAEGQVPPSFSKPTTPPKRQTTARFFLVSFSVITGVLLILVLLFSILRTRSDNPPSSTTSSKPPLLGLDCGQSIASAKANKCIFDLLSYSWTPFPCYERETDMEFREWVANPIRQSGAFPFFLDRNGTMRMSDVEAMSYRAPSLAHTTQEEHLGHCIFWMRRIERILEGKGRFTERGMLENRIPHSLHCTSSLLARLEKGQNPLDRDELHAVIGIGFNSC